jgi:hypothetical protein
MTMTHCCRRTLALLVWVPLLMPGAAIYGQDQFSARLGEAKRLYEAAEYDLALAEMAAIDFSTVGAEQATDGSLYQALCLLALDRTPEAVSKIEQIVSSQPLFRPQDDTPPRVRALVDDVRSRLRPVLVQQHYHAGKALFDDNAHAGAVDEFTLVIQLVDEMDGTPGAAALADIKTLATGFRDLSKRALASGAPAAATAPDAAGSHNGTATGETVAPTRNAVQLTVVPPVAIRQNLPEFPRSASIRPSGLPTRPLNGVLDIVVGLNGQVDSVTLVKRIHPLYDGILVDAAKGWLYRPATRNGNPIPFPKRITVNVTIP